MQRLLIGAVLILGLCGCERKAVVAPIAAAARPAKPPVQPLAIRPAEFIANSAGEISGTANSIWDLKIAWIPEEKLESLGLMEFYSGAPETNGVTQAELARSPLQKLARTYTNILLTVHEGIHVGLSSREVASNLVDRLNKASGVDIVTPMPMQTIGTNEARALVTDSQTIVVATTPSKAPVTSKVQVGSHISLRAMDGKSDTIQVEATVRQDLFNGYGRDESDPLQNMDSPVPLFEVAALGTRTLMKRDEVLLLGGPVQTNITQSMERAKYLSDIPGLGRFFTKVHVNTNRFRALVIIQRRGE